MRANAVVGSAIMCGLPMHHRVYLSPTHHNRHLSHSNLTGRNSSHPSLSVMAETTPVIESDDELPTLWRYNLSGTKQAVKLLKFGDEGLDNGQQTLERLRTLDPETAKHFEVKSNGNKTVRFNLICENKSESVSDFEFESFIAVSYCWHNEEWRPASTCTLNEGPAKAPISSQMLKAILRLRINKREGIWIDQLCIDQSDATEKRQAINHMDAVYRSARTVAIVLEDVELSPDEERLLELLASRNADDASLLLILGTEHVGEERNRLPVSELQAGLSLINKVFDARWSGRAWCYHEYLLSQDHVLLLAGSGGRCFALECRCINLITSALSHVKIIESPLSYFGSKITAFDHKYRGSSQSGSTPFVRIWEACKRGCSYLEDLVSIGLNVADISLNFVGNVDSVDDCRWKLACAALCSGDASVLTSEVTSLALSRTSLRSSWLQWPENVQYIADLPGLNQPRITWNSTIASVGFDSLTLDLFQLTASPKRPSLESRAKASSFLLRCETTFPEILLAVTPDTYLEKKLDDGSIALESATLTSRQYTLHYLACGLDNGILWIKAAFNNLGIEEEEGYNATKDLVNVTITDLFDTSPQDSFDDLEKDAIRKFLFASLNPYCFVTWSDYPHIVSLGPGSQLAAIGYPSILDEQASHDRILAVPVALAGIACTCVRRLWILEKTGFEEKNEWEIIDKTGIVGCGEIKDNGKEVRLLRNARIVGPLMSDFDRVGS